MNNVTEWRKSASEQGFELKMALKTKCVYIYTGSLKTKINNFYCSRTVWRGNKLTATPRRVPKGTIKVKGARRFSKYFSNAFL